MQEKDEMPDWTVSIHTPVKGATSNKRQRRQISKVSIHTPVKGATQ